MTAVPATARSERREGFILALATAVLTVAAAMAMFSTFMFYDDEGYVLLSLQNFHKNGGLYRDVYTQYGPFPFVFYDGLQSLGVTLTHQVGRLITLGAWAGTAWLCAQLVGGSTRHLLLRLAVLTAVFVYLWVMSNEPSHPGGLVVFITALLAYFGYRWIQRGPELGWAITVAAGTTLLLLTKINVGIFAAFSAWAWWVLFNRHERVRRWGPLAVASGGIALPLALMRPLLGTAWVQDFALVFGCAILALVGALGPDAARRGNAAASPRSLIAALLTAGTVTALVIMGILIHTTTLGDLIEGVVRAPLRHALSFNFEFAWPAGSRVLAGTSLALAAGAWYLRRRGVGGVDVVIAALRILLSGVLALNLSRYPDIRPEYHAFALALPCLWLFVWPLAGEDANRTAGRAWLALLFLGQSLHVFPVPGSQIAWGTVLVIPLAAIGAGEAAAWLAQHHRPTWLAPRIVSGGANLGLASFAIWVGVHFVQVASRYPAGQAIGLPGAERIRLPDDSAAVLRVMAQNAAVHADLLFSLPGMFSFNLWTGRPTPTAANVTHWFSLLNAERQQAIIRELETHPRAGIIVYPEHLQWLIDRKLAAKGPLFDYITQNFEPAIKIETLAFYVHRGRRISPFLVAEVFTLSPAATVSAGTESTLLKFTLVPSSGSVLASIELSSLQPSQPVILDHRNARLEITPVNARGEPIGPARPLAWSDPLTGPSILGVYYHRERLASIRPGATVVLRDPQGQEIGLAVISRD